jgi:hypothetical protein
LTPGPPFGRNNFQTFWFYIGLIFKRFRKIKGWGGQAAAWRDVSASEIFFRGRDGVRLDAEIYVLSLP